nr:beta-galactosidase [Armatimonadota bacterium]
MLKTLLYTLLILSVPPALTQAAPLPDYEIASALNTPPTWQAPADVTLSNPKEGMLALTFANLKMNDTRALALRQPIPLDPTVKAVNYWTCYPAAREEFGVSLTPTFADKDGKPIAGAEIQFLGSHIGTANGRKSGLWFYPSEERNPKAVSLTGFSIHVFYVGAGVPPARPHTIFLKDIGLERVDYSKAPLYYVVGNYRDNFDCTAFNGAHARALTDATGGSSTPYVLLDNLLDTAKEGRPPELRLEYAVYDVNDMLVYTGKSYHLPARSSPDFFTKIPIPITSPGTYRIEGKSFDAATGEYFTTDWTKLIILKGSVQPLPPVTALPRLAINPDKPYGRLERTDPRRIVFRTNLPADSPATELRYTVIPYDPGIHGWDAVRTCTLDHTLAVTGPLTVPYEQRHTVELVVAELWQGNHRIDHEERPIGVENAIARAPAFVPSPSITSLQDQAGPGKNWMNVQFHTNPGQSIPDALALNMDEAKKLTPNLGFYIDLKRIEPIPGVYDWDSLTPLFDQAAAKGCRIIPYMALKWPVDWAPVEFQLDSSGCAHRVGTMWGYMVGKYLYPNGIFGPEIIHNFLQQLARRYVNHPGLGGYYLENEHIDTQWMAMPVSRSYHEAYRQHFVEYLAGKYRTLHNLNLAWGTRYGSFDDAALPLPTATGRRAPLVDFRRYQRYVVEAFVLHDQFDPIRNEDPQRPIIIYQIGEESDDFLRHIVSGGGMMANGGIHSDFNFDHEYERMNAVPGLLFRMEPHDMFHYDPVPNGFDEMIF